MTCICGPVLTLYAVHLSASRPRMLSPYGMTATNAWLLSTFSHLRAPQEPPPLIHDAWSGVGRRARQVDEGHYTRAFICIERNSVRAPTRSGRYRGYPASSNQKAAPRIESFILSNECGTNSRRQSRAHRLARRNERVGGCGYPGRAYTDRDPTARDRILLWRL